MCILRVCVLRLYTSALRKLWDQEAGVNRNACVHFACVVLRVYTSALRKLWNQEAGVNRNACVHFARACAFCMSIYYLCAAKVVESAGGSKPERLCAFCTRAFCVCIPLRCESSGIRRRE